MKRISVNKRTNWENINKELGMDFNFVNGDIYWDEGVAYEFTASEIEKLESVTNELNEMCIKAVDYVIDNNRLDDLKIPKAFHQRIIDSWNNDEQSVYGRMDLVYHGNNSEPKLMEYNADTPTSLLEASVVQWHWLEQFKNVDQFNSIHEKLLNVFAKYKEVVQDETLYFTCMEENLEDYRNVEYLMDCASQSGINVDFILLSDIGSDGQKFYNNAMNPQEIKYCFKLYPWENMVHDEFAQAVLTENCLFIEPTWKMILSNKAILPILWEMFPGHPNLLECYFSEEKFEGRDYVKKPIFSREGANVEIHTGGEVIKQEGDYGEEGYIYQAYAKLPVFEGNYTIIGSWVVDGESAGLTIREDKHLITGNNSRFIPHLFK